MAKGKRSRSRPRRHNSGADERGKVDRGGLKSESSVSVQSVQEGVDSRTTSLGKRFRGPVVRFVFWFGVSIATFYAVYLPVSQTQAYKSYLAFLAHAANGVLLAMGHSTEVVGTDIVSPGFRVSVVPGCDGMEALALFGSAVLASPVPLRARLLFLAAGVSALTAMNVLRVLSLYLIGLHFAGAMHTAHWDIWPGILIVMVMVSWFIWAKLALRHVGTRTDAPQ